MIGGSDVSKLLPHLLQLGGFLKQAMDHYALLKQAGKEVSPEIVAVYLQTKLGGWNPRVGERALLDEPTRAAAARFLAGVAINLVGI